MKVLILISLLIVSTYSIAADEKNNWVGGTGYSYMTAGEDGIDFGVGSIFGSLGYRFNTGSNFYWIPEIRVGTGTSDDTVNIQNVNIDLELDSFLAVSLRTQYETGDGFYLFVSPSYANAKITASASVGDQKLSVTEDSWEFGIEAGGGYNFSDNISAELSYETFDNFNFISVGFRFNF